MKNKLYILTLVGTLLLLPSQINSCGMLVHMDVTERALNSFYTNSSYPYEEVLHNHHSYVQSGSPFPDWGYLCETPAGEASHWPPFINALKNYTQATYAPGTEQYNKMLAFTFGVESHVQADVEWHWGKNTPTASNQGFLNSMSHDGSNCADNWGGPGDNPPTCHSDGDVGADFYLGGRGGINWFNETWTIPTSDLSEVYKTMNLTNESPEKIFLCTLTMYCGAILERHFASIITFYYDSRTAFLTEDLDLWYHGGLEDMGAMVSWKWQELTRMFDSKNDSKGVQGESPSCSVFGQGFLKDKLEYYSKMIGISYTVDEFGHHTYKHDVKKLQANSASLVDSILEDMGIENPYAEFTNSHKKAVNRASFGEASQTYESLKSLTYLGKGLAVGDFNGDGVKELFMGAPGYGFKGFQSLGAVYFTSLVNQSNFDANVPYLTGIDPYSRFGFSLAAVDMNGDGIDDLVVSAPAHGTWFVSDLDHYQDKDYTGMIYVYLGQKDVGIVQGAQPDFTIKQQYDPLFNLGWNLQSSDCNGDGLLDLIVLSPLAQQGGDQRGHVGIFYASEKFNGTTKQFMISDSDFSISGTENYNWFGYDAFCTPDQVLVVGIPGKRPVHLNGTQVIEAAGAVQGFSIKDKSLVFSLNSSEDQSKFGKVISYNAEKKILAVGAPARNSGIMYHSGAVYLYDLTKPNLTFDSYQSVIRSNDRGSRFGTQIEWNNDTLIVSAPALTTWDMLGTPNDQGIVYGFHSASTFTGVLNSDLADQQFETSDPGCRHGENMIYSQSTQQLIVGSPFCANTVVNSTEHRLAGRIYIFNAITPALTQPRSFLSE